MTLEELKKKLRDSLADAKERGVTIPRDWFGSDISPDSLKDLGLKVVHTSTSPFSWIKHEKSEISLMEIEQFCHCYDILCLATKSKDDALEIVTAYQFYEGQDCLIAREVELMSLPTDGGGSNAQGIMHIDGLKDMYIKAMQCFAQEEEN